MTTKTINCIAAFTICSFALLSCKKDSFFNLTAEISSETTALEMDESGFTVANIILSDELSEDLPIKLTAEIDDIPNFINENDYGAFEYSNDLGKTWVKASNQTVIFQQRNRNLKIKISAIDDDEIEFHEAFDLYFEPQVDASFDLSGEIEPIRIKVNDNERPKEGNGINDLLIDTNALSGALYAVDEDYNFTLIALNRDNLFDASHKAMIDKGLDRKLIDDITKLTQTGEIPIVRFEALFEDNGLGGYVFNHGYGEDKWEMGLNLYTAYYEQNPTTGAIAPIEYNSNGRFGHILTHEYGHILTLNQKIEADFLYAEDECQNYSNYQGCFHTQSVLNQFNDIFYDPLIPYNEPVFVSNYSQTNIVEDIAETFAWSIGQKVINPANSESSGALKKIHFAINHPHLQDARSKILQTDVNVIAAGGSPIDNKTFNHTKDGKRISCLDHREIVKAIQEKKFSAH